MIETKHIIAELSVQEKICLYNALYEDLASKGIDGDTELAHVNKAEMDVLRAMGGSGTINPNTGLIQFGGGSPPPPPPATQSVTQQTEFPSELKPYITDVLSKAQAIQEKRESEGYVPYEGPQLAAFTPEQEQAFAGISGLVGQGEQYFDPATRLAASSAIAPRAGEVQQYMSPYMQNVVEIQQREAQRQADVAAQQLGAQAVGAGAYGGSRQAILEAEQQRNLQQQLGDIQARGLAAAYEDAQRRIAEQRGRELSASGQFMQLGQVAPAQQQRELTALEAVGAQRQAQSQRGLDIARSEFEREQLFPEQTLQQYQSVIRGFPLAPTTYQTRQTTTPAPSYLQQAAGLGMGVAGLAGAFGNFGRTAKAGGLVSRMQGGQVDQNNGLGSIVVKKQEGGRFVPPTRSRYTDPNYQNPIGKSIEELVDALGKGLIDPPTFEYRIEQLRKGYNKAGMPLEQEPIPKELGRSPLSVSPVEARIAAQKRKRDLSSDKSMVDPASPMSMLMSAMENRKFANAPTTKGIPIEEMNKKDIDPTSQQAMLRDAMRNPKFVLNEQIQAGIGGTNQPTVSPTSTPKPQKAVETDIIVYQDKKDTPFKTGSSILDQFKKDLGIAKDKVSEFNKMKKGLLEKQKEGMDSQRWLSLAQLGASILSQPGGQTFLQALGKGVTESNFVDRLASLNDKEQQLALNIASLDKDTMVEQLGLSEKQADLAIKERNMARQDTLLKLQISKELRDAALKDRNTDLELAKISEAFQKFADINNFDAITEMAKSYSDPRVKDIAKAIVNTRTETAAGRAGDNTSPSTRTTSPSTRGSVAATIPDVRVKSN